jgi:hypothetical protein
MCFSPSLSTIGFTLSIVTAFGSMGRTGCVESIASAGAAEDERGVLIEPGSCNEGLTDRDSEGKKD